MQGEEIREYGDKKGDFMLATWFRNIGNGVYGSWRGRGSRRPFGRDGGCFEGVEYHLGVRKGLLTLSKERWYLEEMEEFLEFIDNHFFIESPLDRC